MAAPELFKLSATLKGHEDDVRAVLFPSPDLVVSSSLDCSVRLWKHDKATSSYTQFINSAGAGSINSLAWVPSSLEHPHGLIISGGKETIIEARAPLGITKQDAEYLMLGHSSNVCALDVYGDTIVSGSWDWKARVWSKTTWETVHILEGHSANVWAVLVLENDLIVTGSADKTMRMWRNGKLVKVLNAHTDCVRGLCRLPQGGFASCANDATIRIWSNDGHQLHELHGHTHFIYSIAALPNGDIVSSSEDRTVKVWREGACIQTIMHPALTVWTVAVCQETGDIVSGASDKIARVFSRHPERWADKLALKEFEDTVAASSIPSTQMGDINKERLPGPEALQRQGTKDGQVIMIRNGDVVEAQIWSQATSSWTLVGTVVDAVGSSHKKEFEGKEYDYVFDVDIKEGAPPLKLPYNVNQNPYDAATKFLERNNLPMGYLETVADFVVKNTSGAKIGQESESSNDPYGIESRYRPGEAAAAPSSPETKFLPHTSFLQITQANLPLIKKKLIELNERLLQEGNKDICLNPEEIEILETLTQVLEAKQGPGPTSKATMLAMPTLARIITTWDATQRLPALDLLRLTAAASPVPTTYISPGDAPATLIDMLEVAGVFDKNQPNNAMLGTRVFVNIFDSSKSREFAEQYYERILQLVLAAAEGTVNKNLKVAVATLGLNYSVLFATKQSTDRAKSLLQYLISAVANEDDPETLFRSMVAVGTLISMGGDVKKTAVKTYLVRKAVDIAVSKVKELRIQQIGREITALL